MSEKIITEDISNDVDINLLKEPDSNDVPVEVVLKESILTANDHHVTEVPFKTEEEIKEERKGCCNFCQRLWNLYDKSFLFTLGL